jgi:hypothetical protein
MSDKDGHAFRILDQTHGDAGHRCGSSERLHPSSPATPPHTVAIEDEPFDSVISETRRIV